MKACQRGDYNKMKMTANKYQGVWTNGKKIDWKSRTKCQYENIGKTVLNCATKDKMASNKRIIKASTMKGNCERNSSSGI